ncbi:MAG: hypothetical protein AB1393_10160 [Candidatus Edwardsbacteria bacterium]
MFENFTNYILQDIKKLSDSRKITKAEEMVFAFLCETANTVAQTYLLCEPYNKIQRIEDENTVV